jgi:hypothetical protein
LELVGVQCGEDVAEVIMRRRAILEWAKPAEQRELLCSEKRDLGEAFRAGQHGEQAQKQDLVERISHFAALARILEILEIAQKNNRLGECRTVHCRAVHDHSPSSESRVGIDSAL